MLCSPSDPHSDDMHMQLLHAHFTTCNCSMHIQHMQLLHTHSAPACTRSGSPHNVLHSPSCNEYQFCMLCWSWGSRVLICYSMLIMQVRGGDLYHYRRITESVDSVCRDTTYTQYMPIQKNLSKSQKRYTYKPL